MRNLRPRFPDFFCDIKNHSRILATQGLIHFYYPHFLPKSLLLAIGILFGVGGATMFSINLGEGKTTEADIALGNSFMMLLISGVCFLIIGQIFLTPLLRLFGAGEAVFKYSEEYMRMIFWGAIFQVTSLGMNNFLRADGQPRLAMITMFVGAGVNIILDPIFIYIFHMGMAGAALATIISQCISMIWILAYFFSSRTLHRIRLRTMRLRRNYVKKISYLGLPSFVLQLGNSLLNIVLNQSLLAYGGDIAVSGMGIVNSVQTILLMPITGLNQGVQPIISFNFGARKYTRVKKAEVLAIIVATSIVVIGWLLTRLFPAPIVSLFNREPQLIHFGSYALLTWFWCLPVIGFQILAANFFQAIGRSRSAMVLTLTRQFLFLIPAILIFSWRWGLNGLLFAAPFADGLSAIITGVYFYYGMKSLSTCSTIPQSF